MYTCIIMIYFKMSGKDLLNTPFSCMYIMHYTFDMEKNCDKNQGYHSDSEWHVNIINIIIVCVHSSSIYIQLKKIFCRLCIALYNYIYIYIYIL